MKQVLCLLLAAGLLLSLAACAGTVPADAILIPEESSGELHFYGVVKSAGIYYVCVQPDTDGPEYIPLADALYAEFQPDGWVGGWAPDQFFTARELARADKDGAITHGVRFSYRLTDGRIDRLVEYDPYQDNNVTGS